MNLLPPRWHARLSASIQSLLLVGILCAIPWAVDLPNAFPWIDLRPAWSSYVPPLWYFGVYEALLGRADALDRSLAARGFIAGVIVLFTTFLVSAIFYRRYAKRIFEAEEQSRGSRSNVIELMAEWSVKASRESAILLFGLRSISRMKQHRMIRLVYAGMGCALVLESGIGVILSGAFYKGRIDHGAALDAVFALPLALFFFLFTGLRYAFRIPVDLRANWIFRLTAPDATAEREKAVRWIYLCFALLPAQLTTAPFLIFVAGWKGIYGLAFACLVAMLIIEHELNNSDTIPLTCSYLPGKRNILHTGIIYWLAVFAITTVLTAFEAIGSRTQLRAALILLMLVLIYWRMRRKEEMETPELRFDDLPEPAVATLGLSRE